MRDLDLWGQPSFWIYRPPYHRCPWCNHRQFLIPPFKRKDTSYTYRFEQQVLRLLIGSNEEEVARRLGVSRPALSRLEHDIVEPTTRLLNALAAALDTTPDALV